MIDSNRLAEFMIRLAEASWLKADDILREPSINPPSYHSTPDNKLSPEEAYFLRALDQLIIARTNELRS